LPASSEPARRTKAREIDTWSTTSSGMLARARVSLRKRLAEEFRVAAQGVHGRGTFERAARRALWGLDVIRDGSRGSRCRLGRACGLRVRQAAGVGVAVGRVLFYQGPCRGGQTGGRSEETGSIEQQAHVGGASKPPSAQQTPSLFRDGRSRQGRGQGACARRRRCGF
jgi:hypothetical protein